MGLVFGVSFGWVVFGSFAVVGSILWFRVICWFRSSVVGFGDQDQVGLVRSFQLGVVPSSRVKVPHLLSTLAADIGLSFLETWYYFLGNLSF